MAWRRYRLRWSVAVALLVGSSALVLPRGLAQAPSTAADEHTSPPGRVVLVLPFDNHSGDSALDWIGDSFPDTLNQRLGTSGFLPLSREDRAFALDHLGLPADFRPSRATTLRIAQTLDANFVVVGSYTVTNQRLSVQARVVRVDQLRMSAPLADSAELQRLYDVENAIAWKVARDLDPQTGVSESTFLAASGDVPLSSFENYIRGVNASSQSERLRRLQAAVQETPSYTPAVLALGKAQFSARDFEKAGATLSRVPVNDRRALEARFYLGLARFNEARYADAEQAWAFVAQRLPLPEVVNNEAVAVSRQGRDGAALFQRAVAADPNDPDYHYNLAVSLLRRHDSSGARREVDAALRLRKGDAEAQQLRDAITRGVQLQPVSAMLPATGTAASSAVATDDSFAPLERVRRTFSEASFRQAAFQLDQMQQLRLSMLKPPERSAEYTQLGQSYLGEGLLPEAEQEFQRAVAADSRNPAARAGLAEIREQSGDDAAARAEAEASLRLQPNVAALLVLARLRVKGKDLAGAAAEVSQALQLEPRNAAALAMRQNLTARGQAIP